MSIKKNEKDNQKSNSMLNQKTNEDHNRQKPNPSDPNQMNDANIVKSDIILKKKKRETSIRDATIRLNKENELNESDDSSNNTH